MKIKNVVLSCALLAVCLFPQGCALLLVGAAAAGGAVGAVSYYGNELQTIQEITLDKAWTAAQATANALQFKTEADRSRKDGIKGILYCRNADSQPVLIRVIRQSDKLTEVRIRVGTFDTASNRHAAQTVFEKMRSRM
ncbi:MAG: DUF3568 family protein [Verrucomicrobia bacterium]|nr:DUF3568 family protein [Verrucomicrobiota bacterium]